MIWEYKYITGIGSGDYFNYVFHKAGNKNCSTWDQVQLLGSEGWELVSTTMNSGGYILFVFKRPS